MNMPTVSPRTWIATISKMPLFAHLRLISAGIHAALICAMVVQAFMPFMMPAAVSASGQELALPRTLQPSPVEHPRSTLPLTLDQPLLSAPVRDSVRANNASNPASPDLQGSTTLTVSIVSSPWAILDSNNPTGDGEEVPRVFVVEAVITNTGPLTETATDLVVGLDYNEDPANNWILMPGEYPTRTLPTLAPGAAYHAYWFARYSTIIGASHQYTVTALASNASQVATSHNSFDNGILPAGSTVQTKSYQSTGNSGVTQTSVNIVVGVAFTVSVTYDLGVNPQQISFSPVGNLDFDPSAYRLLSSQVRFYNDAQPPASEVYYDRLYFDTLPSVAKNAEVSYTFIALITSFTQLCPYTGIGYASTSKYDQFYCSNANPATAIPVTGTLSFSLTKQVSNRTIQQGQPLTYTIYYTNNGSLPLSYVWIWDDVPPGIGSIIPASIQPVTGTATSSQVAWNLGEVPVGARGTLTFTLSVDGQGQDLNDNAVAENRAFLGINPGSGLPEVAALTHTVTSTIQAPIITLSKTDEQANVEPGDALTYTLRITNSGSITATGLVITDVLPAEVNYVSHAATPDATAQAEQALTWNNLGPILPSGGTIVVTIPVTTGLKVPNGTVLTDMMTVKYENAAAHIFATKTATDTTTVQAPVLAISKSGFPDPVLTGHLITYTLHYTNSGPAPATNVVITDRLPLSTTFQSCMGGSACDIMAGGVVSWTLGTIAGGNASGDVSFSVRVSDTLNTGEQIHNGDYGIGADQTDFVPGPPITTLVSKNAAFVVGYAFDDANGNGLRDGGETGLSSVNVTLANSTVMVTPTDGSGYYSFRIETSGPVSVTSDVPANYFRTTPGTVFTNAALEITQTISFGYAPLTSTFGVIYGTVFEDANHNGVQNLGESGLQNVTLTSAEAVETPAATDLYGRYTFSYTISGTVTITEGPLTFYVSTTPDVVHTNAITGSGGPSPIDFGDFQGIQVVGQVFTDTNVNGVKDVWAGGISGATVAANGDSFTTGSTGVYTLYVTVRDSNPITVAETNLAGYLSTNAIPGANMSKIDADTLRIGSPVSGTSYSGDFGDVLASAVVTISGWVWNDNGACADCLAANGLFDSGEQGLAGAVVGLSSGLTQTTASNGSFLLYAAPGQVITVAETNLADYASTNAIPGNGASKVDNDTLVINALSAGSVSAGNLFGDVPIGSVALITGTVYNDSNENGKLDTGESGLPGITVTLEISGGITVVVPTDWAGHYQFAVARGTAVRIASASPGSAFYPTTPPSVMVQPLTAGVFPNNDFGYSNDAGAAVIYGIVYDDGNSNGRQDLGELGLAGAVVALNGNAPITTTGNGLVTGTFTYRVTQAALYTVHEANPSGYRSTTLDDLNVEVAALGRSYFVDFGDTNSDATGTVLGIVFDDVNGNGQWDSGEPGLPGVVVSMTVSGRVLTVTTKSYGQYTYGFEVGEAGYHTVSEQDPARPGYRSTTPDQVNVQVFLGRSSIVNFGDTNASGFSTIMGTVFSDESGDAVQDPSELGIRDVPVSLSNGLTTMTDPNGGYTFSITTPSFVQVTETDLSGYHSTTPNTVTVNVAALNQVYGVNFGDSNRALLASIFGTVFDDQNANGARDLTEPGLNGVTVNITPTASGLAVSYVTNEWGQYTFQIEVAGTFIITETDLPGHVSTIAIPGAPAVTKVNNNTLRATINTLGIDLGDNLFGDVVASQVITISGSVWNDNGAGNGTAGDSVQNGSESLLAGATISLSGGMAQTTGSDGTFLLYALPGVITVTETNPAGYVSTGVIAGASASKIDNDTLSVSGLSAGSESSGNRFGDALPADLSIVKSGSFGVVLAGTTLTYTLIYTNNGPAFAQGVYITDTLPAVVVFGGMVSADPSLPGFGQSGGYITWYTPTLDAGASGTIIFTVTVDSDVEVGTNIVNSVVITSNTPDTYTVNNSSVHAAITVNAAADLSVTKSDSPDSVMAGTTLTYTLVYKNDGPSDAQGVVITDTLPSEVTFGGVASQPLSLSGPTRSGRQLIWTAPTLVAGASGTIIFTVTVDVSASGMITNNVVIASSTPDPVVGNGADDEPTTVTGAASIFGMVFDDTNGNGVRDAGEAGISGARITLDGTTTTTTDSNGHYAFFVTAAGAHTLVETDLSGYRSTTPNTVVLNVTLGNSYRVDFGDVPTGTSETWATILGVVFHDANGNGTQDSGEVGLSGVTVTLDGATAITTDLYGRYSFSTTVAGVHAVVETDLSGYRSTTPNTVTLRVALGLSYQVNFGDAPVTSGFAAIYGTVFNDANANKTYDMNEEGIPGVLITLDGGITTTTNIYGGYSLTTTIPGQHLVAETDPPGYSSTTLNVIKVDVTLGSGYPVDFGDTTVSLCSPDAYEKDDSAALARGLGSSVQAHNFCEDATDWVTFTAHVNNVYTITTRASGQRADTIMALYGADGVTLLTMNDDHPSTTDFSSRIVWRASANGVYYVQITNRGGLTGRDTDYDLWKNEQVRYLMYLPIVMQNSGVATTGLSANSRLSPLGVITHTLPDVYEIDDTWQQAKTIAPGDVQTHTFDSPTDAYVPDKDYVRFRVFPGSVVTFTVLSRIGTIPTLELYGPTGDPYQEGGRWLTSSLSLIWIVPDSRPYYIAAFDPEATVPAAYALQMQGTPIRELYLPLVMRSY